MTWAVYSAILVFLPSVIQGEAVPEYQCIKPSERASHPLILETQHKQSVCNHFPLLSSVHVNGKFSQGLWTRFGVPAHSFVFIIPFSLIFFIKAFHVLKRKKKPFVYWVTNPGNGSHVRVGGSVVGRHGIEVWRMCVRTPTCSMRQLPRTLGQLSSRISRSTESSIFQGPGRQFHPWHPERGQSIKWKY